ncbi:MAG TPA: winged helix-turn-helix domain-containing protein, partial [Gammaproteobacteria bacterium]|nr:winged helix-turn-helix domain-containing protein [Gammaproteobacteria bacterium]
IDAVWPDVVVTDDSLIHAISVLRRALGDDPNEAHYVQTVPRRGYRFVARVSIPAEAQPAHGERAAEAQPAHGERAAEPDTAPAARRPRWTISTRVRALLAGAALAAAAGLALVVTLAPRRDAVPHESPAAPARRAVRLFQPAPDGTTIVSGGVLSPDGESLTFVARDAASGETALWVRALHSSELRRLAHTQGAAKPFWSADSGRLGFFSDGELKTVALRDGEVRAIAPVGLSAAGGTWAPDDTILFAAWARGLYSVRASGSTPALVAALDEVARDIAISWPQFFPDGRHFLYQVVSLDAARTGVYLGDLDTRRSVRLLDTESPAVFAPPRHLLHVERDMLIADELDSSTWQLTGRATVLARDVSATSLADNNVVSAAGDLVAYRGGVRQQQLAWVDRAGQVLATLPMPAVVFNPRVSPDGSHLLATGSPTTDPGLWLASLSRPEFERIETDAIGPLWSPDGARIAYTSRGGADLLIRAASGAESRRLIGGGAVKILNDWSPGGDHIIYSQRDESTGLDLWGVDVENGSTFAIMRTPHNELQARISPDGRWLAYVADDDGTPEVYVQHYPELGERYKISAGGGGQPQWRRDQSELYYIGPDRALMAVAIERDGGDPFGAPRRLFRTPVAGDAGDARDYYAAAPDGGRFLLDGRFGDGNDSAITVVVNWSAETQTPPASERVP